jgi:hypothetical protein
VLTSSLLALSLLVGVPLAPQATPAPDCDWDPVTGKCLLRAGDDGHLPTGSVTRKPGAKTPGGSACVFKGQVVPCRTKDGFYDGASECYLTPTDKPRLSFFYLDPKALPPGTRFYTCWAVIDVVNGKPVGAEVFPSIIRDPSERRTIDPRVAARQVVKTMNFVAPQLGVSPYVQSADHVGIVNVPIWMWVTDAGPTTTGPQTKTAALGGVSITATGTVDRIEWSMGAGDTVTCKGAGTAFTKEMAAGKSLKDMPSSPTCGYKYSKSSRCQKSGAYNVTATAYWTVHWTGGGMQGDIPLDFSRSIPLRITDLRPVLVDPDGGSTSPSTAPRTCSN